MLTQNQISPEEIDHAHRAATRLVRNMACRNHSWLDTEVLENEARLAVVLAGRAYQPDRSTQFHTFAYRVVTSRLGEEWRRQCPWTRRARKIRRQNLQAGLPMAGWMQSPVSLHAPVGGDEGSARLEETVAARDEWTTHEARITVAQLLAHLEPRRCEVVRRYYLLGEETGEIAAALGVSPGRVSQLKQQALEALRAAAGVPPASPGKRPALSPDQRRLRKNERCRAWRARQPATTL